MTMSLSIVSPLKQIVRMDDIVSVRAEDASGAFGVHPGHHDFMTVIDAGILRWKQQDQPWTYCALRGGIFTVTGGKSIEVACREAVMSENLTELEDKVMATRAELREEIRQARSSNARLHAKAIRRMMKAMSAGGSTTPILDDDA